MTNFTNEKINELLVQAQAKVDEVNKAISKNVHTDISSARKEANLVIEALNSEIVSEMFSRLLSTENPVLEALKQCYYTTYSLKVAIDKDTKVETATLVEKLEIVDIKALGETAEKNIFVDGQWYYAINKFAYLMSKRVEKNLNIKSNLKNDYKISKIARELNLGGEMTSNTQILKALQTIIDMIVSLNKKALKCDIKFIQYLMVKKGSNGLSVKLPSTKSMTRLVTVIIHRIITNGKYTSEYEITKKSTKQA